MPIYDHKCEEGHFTEDVKDYDDRETKCRKCGKPAKRVISMTGVNCINEDAPWIRDVLDVVDKDSKLPHVQEFLKNPTRSAWKKWMKVEGIRVIEDGEKTRHEISEREERQIEQRMSKQLMERHMNRKRIIVHG